MAMILEFFVERYLGELANFVEGETRKVLEVKKEIKKLKRRLERIRGYLQDAEQKRHGNADINTWVRELKDLVYDADDIIDLCMLERGQSSETQQSDSGVCFPFCLLSSCFKCMKYRREVSSRIKELNGRLKEIADDRQIIDRLGLQYSNQAPKDNRVSSQETYPLEVKSDIIGTQIEDAAGSLINGMIQNDKEKCRVTGIVGMGGIGKTTLARKIFNDERIKEKFPMRIWLHVSKNYSEIDLLKKIIRDAGGNIEVDESKAGLVQEIVRLVWRNFFLVLDDVWHADVWENLLREPIISGAARAQILVTTRDETVATSMRASYIHPVQKMDEESGWALLRKMVFGDEERHEILGFKDIGIKIVKKCDGLPLAIKAIGGVLRSRRRSRMEWEKVLKSDSRYMKPIEKDPLPRALYLSYEDLSFHLKQCFLYCSLHPVEDSDDLVPLWVAEGFIVEQGDRSMEEIGEDYYRELIWRNLLQPDPAYADGSVFSVHDLLRSLGEGLMEGEGISLRHDPTLNLNSTTKIRRLSMSNEGDTLTLPDVIMEQNCLRTLLLFDSPQTKTISDDVLARLRRLRVLGLRGTSIEIVPHSIGELLHLRYLDLAETEIREIPESIGRLANLQTLDASNCQSLRGLPKAITSLHNLRCLDLLGTPVTHVPRGIGRLKNLNVLSGFVVGYDDVSTRELKEGCDLEELRSLSKLRNLSIHRLERATNGASVLLKFPMLRKLVLQWTRFQTPRSSEDQIQRAKTIFDALSPPSSLGDLTIHGYPDRRLPGWMTLTTTPMGDALFPDLEYLKLWDMPSCMELPPLGQLPLLKYLVIRGAEAIKTIGPQFLGGGGEAPAFPKLEYLEFENMPSWENWVTAAKEKFDGGRKRQLLPNLKVCVLDDCPKLRALPDGLRHATKLEKLTIRNTNMREINDLPFLTDTLEVVQREGLEMISNLPSLRNLAIVDCPSLEYVENLDTLQLLYLECPPQAEHLPRWLSGLIEQHQSAPSTQRSLKKFDLLCDLPLLDSCLNCLSGLIEQDRIAPSAQRSFKKFELHCGLPLLNSCREGEANWHIIQHIPEVEIRTSDGSKFILYTKEPRFYETNSYCKSFCLRLSSPVA